MAPVEHHRVLAQRLVFGSHTGIREHDAPPADLPDDGGIRADGAGLTRHLVPRTEWRALSAGLPLPDRNAASMIEVIIGRTCRMVGVIASHARFAIRALRR